MKLILVFFFSRLNYFSAIGCFVFGGNTETRTLTDGFEDRYAIHYTIFPYFGRSRGNRTHIFGFGDRHSTVILCS